MERHPRDAGFLRATEAGDGEGRQSAEEDAPHRAGYSVVMEVHRPGLHGVEALRRRGRTG